MNETKNLAEAIAKLQTRLPAIAKTKTAKVKSDKGNYSYNYADLPQITEKLMPILGELGLSFIAKPTLVEGGRMVLAYKLLHVSGEFEEGEYPLPASGTPQSIGSAITYARRYCLCAITGVAADEDDDGQTAEDGHAAAVEAAQAERERARQAQMQANANELRDQALDADASVEDLQAVYKDAARKGVYRVPVENEIGDQELLGELITRRGKELKELVSA